MKKSFFINGGAGRVLCSIPALEYYKENVDPDVVIVSEAWNELFLTSPSLRHNVWPANSKGLWDKLRETEIISPEPYRLNAYFNQKVNLIQAFDMLINYDVPPSDLPETKSINLEINKVDQIYGYNLVDQVKQQSGKKKVVVFQPLGSGAKKDGNFIFDSSGRSFEVRDIFRVVEELSKNYAVILMTNIDIPTDKQMGAVIPSGANLLQWMGIINAADYFLGCDSMGQHYAHALKKPATVVIGATYPENISYPDNKDFTIIDVGKDKRKYQPYRVTMDFALERDSEDLMIFDDNVFKRIIKSVTDKLGVQEEKSTKKPALGNNVPNLFPKAQPEKTPTFPLPVTGKSSKRAKTS
jgi:hypothetical protein